MSEFVDYLGEVFQQFGAIRARRMFGGYGVYHDDLMFGLVADDVLYLKADDQSAGLFTEKGLMPFEYVKNGKPMKMSYYTAPEEIFDDPDVAEAWARHAYDAALRSKKPAQRG
ncbi:MAG: TfoX/Sxy family protein [Pseudomonadota bacterium]